MNDPKVDERKGWTSASNAEADRLCPGRHLAQKEIPAVPEEEDEDAKFGIVVHKALATGDLTGLSFKQQELVNNSEKIASETAAGFFPPGEVEPPVHFFSEERIWNKFNADGFPEALWHSGRVDRVYTNTRKALILEFKSLFGDIPNSPHNEQLRDQSVLVAGKYRVPIVGCAVVQPKITHKPEVCIYDLDDLARAEFEMHTRVALSNNPGSNRVPGEVQCKFCRAKTRCLEYQKWAGSSLPVPVSLIDTTVADWTPEMRAQFLARRAVAQQWLDDAYEAMKIVLKANPGAIPGYAMKDGAEVRSVTDPQVLFDRFVALKPGFEGVMKLFMTAVNIGNTKFEEAVGELTGLRGKKLDSAVNELFQGVVKTKQNKPSIVKMKGKK